MQTPESPQHPVIGGIAAANPTGAFPFPGYISPAPTIIQPTVGRRVWYFPSEYDRGLGTIKPLNSVMHADGVQPCDAGICYVHSTRMINLSVTDHNGVQHARTSVKLLQDGDEVPEGGGYAMWMPYQVGQARNQVVNGG